jgi:hypothetical protein
MGIRYSEIFPSLHSLNSSQTTLFQMAILGVKPLRSTQIITPLPPIQVLSQVKCRGRLLSD